MASTKRVEMTAQIDFRFVVCDAMHGERNEAQKSQPDIAMSILLKSSKIILRTAVKREGESVGPVGDEAFVWEQRHSVARRSITSSSRWREGRVGGRVE
jgi:hypothetical protein